MFCPRASGPAGSPGVRPLHVRQRPTAAALDGHGQHTTGAGQTVAQTGPSHLTPTSHTYDVINKGGFYNRNKNYNHSLPQQF